MRIVLWVGNESLQKALAHKIHHQFPLTAIVIETRLNKRKITLQSLVEKGIEKLFLSQISKAWYGMLRHYEKQYPIFPNVPVLDVENINSENAYAFTEKYQPDLIIVSGTRLIKKKMLSLKPSIGILNLHTGLSPYIKGGPNCTNWCLATKQFHLIGNTIMWIDDGIDSGNILTTEFTQLNGNESLLDLHVKVLDHAHDLYVRSLTSVSKGTSNNVPQSSIGEGTTFYNKEWNLKQKIRLVRNFRHFKDTIISKQVEKHRALVQTISLNPLRP